MSRVIHRRAVRAVATRGPFLLMMFVPEVGGFKFPGGGVDAGETDDEALARELLEETGRTLDSSGLGDVLHVDVSERPDRKFEDAVFRHESVYYQARVTEQVAEARLDASERAAGMRAGWVEWGLAISANQTALTNPRADEYLARDLRVMELLQPILATAA